MEDYQAEDFAADESFIQYYLKSDSEAIAFWEHWIRTHPEKLDEIAAAEALLDILTIRLPQHEFQLEKAKLLNSINPTPIRVYSSRKKSYWFVAASITLLIGLSTLFLLVQQRKNPARQQLPVEWVHRTNPNGKKARIQLSDGSTVLLNAGSTLHYPKTFSGDKRELRLEGEAYFSVAHDSLSPFIVHTGSVDTKVLGTEFNIAGYTPEKIVSITLVKGSVQVSTPQQSTLMYPGQKVEYKGNMLHTTVLNTELDLGWKDGKLVFQNADFETIALAIQRTYGYKVINRSAVRSWQYTGIFQNEPVTTVIDKICFSKHLNYTVTKQTIYLSAEK
ncbi:MAG: FecR domain-containing protein [Siphonobacter sp.]